MKKKLVGHITPRGFIPLVPNKPGWWWRWDDLLDASVVEVTDEAGRMEYTYLGNEFLVSDDGLWGGPVTPPKWTQKVSSAKQEVPK